MSPFLLRPRPATFLLAVGVLALGSLTAATLLWPPPKGRDLRDPAVLGPYGRRFDRSAVTTGSVQARIYLAGADPAGLAAFATAVSTPGNPQYGGT